MTAVHNANIMKLGDGLFLESVRKVARKFEDLEYEERIVDATSMHLVMHQGQFDVLLLPNLYGDIVSDLCAGLVAGLGLMPSATSASSTPYSRRCTAQRRTSPVSSGRTRPPCCCRRC